MNAKLYNAGSNQQNSDKEQLASIAKGDQGAGRTLEKLLGVPENNLSLPDFGEIEIKSQKFENKTLISLQKASNSTPSDQYHY